MCRNAKLKGVVVINPKVSLTSSFLCLLIRPKSSVERIILNKPKYKGIILFLFVIGTLRGLTEGIWILSMNHQLGQVFKSFPLLYSYLLQGLPFVLSNITTAFVRWAAFAFFTFACGVLMGGRGRFADFLRIYGVILGIFFITILPNFLYLFFNLPSIRFNVSAIYNPTIGLGQILTSCWLAYVSYQAVMQLHKLPPFESFLIGLLVPLLNIGILVLGAAVVFNFHSLADFPLKTVFNLSTIGFTVATLAAIPAFLWLGSCFDKKRKKVNTKKN